MLARLRSTTIALLSAVTLVGLGLIAFIAQLGFPGAFNGAIPDGPGGSAAVHDAIALTPGPGIGNPTLVFHRPSARVRAPSRGASGPGTGPDLGSLNQAGHAPPAGKSPGEPAQPPSTSVPEPAGEPAPAPETPAPSAASPKPEAPAQPEKSSSKKSKSRGHSRNKAKSQAKAKSDTASSGGSKGHRSGKPGRHSATPSKPTHDSADKSGESGGPPSKPSGAPPPSESSEKKSPEVEDRETGGPGKSGRSHH